MPRLFGSITPNFQDRGCFFWINRSYEVKEEASILHFDIEWYTKDGDNIAPERLLKLRVLLQ